MTPSTIQGINRLPEKEKLDIYSRIIPSELLERFQISRDSLTRGGNGLFKLKAPPEAITAETYLFHKPDFPDPVQYGQISDTMNGQFHILMYVLNDPDSPRFNVDVLPDGRKTQFGILHRNIDEEIRSMQYGLSPGQVRRGLRLLRFAMNTFESFIASVGHDLHFAEPLFYHNATIFEQYGFAYQQGRKLMERIQAGFAPGGDLLAKLDGSTPFRQPEAANSIRLRSWAIHDGILGEPFTDVTMYKRLGKQAGLNTCQGCDW